MNPSFLELLCIDMRALGIKSLALELETLPSELPSPTHADDGQLTQSRERDTLTPGDPEAESKDPKLCIAPGCGETNGGLFGGSAGGAFCRKHALARAGVGR